MSNLERSDKEAERSWILPAPHEDPDGAARFRWRLRLAALVLGLLIAWLLVFFTPGCPGVRSAVFGKLAEGGAASSEQSGDVEANAEHEATVDELREQLEEEQGSQIAERITDISIGRLRNFLPGGDAEVREIRPGAAGTDASAEGPTGIPLDERTTAFLLEEATNETEALVGEPSRATRSEPGEAGGDGAQLAGPSPAIPPDPNVMLLSDDFTERLRAAGAKSGDIQISLMWNNVNDLDLHCIDPNGEEIFYRNRVSASGGELDVDMNVSRPLSSRPVENIYWPRRAAPPGLYKIYVNHYRNHGGQEPTQFTVRIFVRGRTRQFTGVIRPIEGKKFVHQFLLTAGTPPPYRN